MLTAIKGYYEKGKIIMNEDTPVKMKDRCDHYLPY
jgi:hypothetical protein